MKKALLIIFISILLLLVAFHIYDANYHKYRACQDGDTSKWQSRLSNSKSYQLALDNTGKPIFRDPNRAFKQLKKDYKMALKEIKRQYKITFNINKYNYKSYYNLSWQLVTNDKKLQEQCLDISYILGIYENSILKYWKNYFWKYLEKNTKITKISKL